MSRRYRPLVFPQVQPHRAPRPLLVSRYAAMNPLLRWCSLQVLAEPLPEPLRASLIHAWQHPGRFDGNQAIQSLHRQRLAEEALFLLSPARLGIAAQVELEAGRRIVEFPRAEMSQQERSRLLRSQGAYLAQVYAALVRQLGEARARAEFEQRLLAIR
jgi:hypothetical protein